MIQSVLHLKVYGVRHHGQTHSPSTLDAPKDPFRVGFQAFVRAPPPFAGFVAEGAYVGTNFIEVY